MVSSNLQAHTLRPHLKGRRASGRQRFLAPLLLLLLWGARKKSAQRLGSSSAMSAAWISPPDCTAACARQGGQMAAGAVIVFFSPCFHCLLIKTERQGPGLGRASPQVTSLLV